jgi:hypothetical protein
MVGALSASSQAPRARRATARTIAGPVGAALAFGCALTAVLGTIGGDARWLPAARGEIPDGVPFASAPSAGWPNVPALAELTMHGLDAALGDRGLALAQLAAVAAALAILAVDMRRAGARDSATALALSLVVVGAIPALVLIRVQLFSLALFPLLVLLLRAEAREPSRRIWLLVPLVALWSNLHGAVLVGLAVAGAYLVFSRARTEPVVALLVLVACLLALCATPALERTPDYYLGVLHNDAARRGIGLWASLSLTNVFDLILIATAVPLCVLALRRRPALWEVVALAGLAILTVKTARSGVWLLFFAAPPAAAALRGRSRDRRLRISAPAAVVAVALTVYGVARGPLPSGAGQRLLDEALVRAGGTPILADGILAEQVALAGGRVWMSNPLDAFSSRDQRLYVDWLDGRPAGAAAIAHAPRVVFVGREARARKLAAASPLLRRIASDDQAILYVRRR